jgi:hypothetical protein
MCGTVDCLQMVARIWDAHRMMYRATVGPNSNTFVGAAAKVCGLAVWPPVTTYGWYWR